MTPLYLNQSAHIVDQICESDVERRPHHSDSSEKHSFQHENKINRLATCIVIEEPIFYTYIYFSIMSCKYNNYLQISPLQKKRNMRKNSHVSYF